MDTESRLLVLVVLMVHRCCVHTTPKTSVVDNVFTILRHYINFIKQTGKHHTTICLCLFFFFLFLFVCCFFLLFFVFLGGLGLLVFLFVEGLFFWCVFFRGRLFLMLLWMMTFCFRAEVQITYNAEVRDRLVKDGVVALEIRDGIQHGSTVKYGCVYNLSKSAVAD